MTAKKAAAKKAPAKARKAREEPVEQPGEPQTVVQDAPEVEGESYKVGFHGVSQDDADYSIAAEVARLSESE